MLRGVPKMKPSSRLVSHLLRTSALGVSRAAAAALAAPAFAQDAAAADRPAPQADPYDDSGIIIVTAQGRAQALSDVPVAISAVGAEAMQNSGANDIRQLNQVAPSLLVSSTGSEANGSARSEERRVGKEGVRTGRSRGWP